MPAPPEQGLRGAFLVECVAHVHQRIADFPEKLLRVFLFPARPVFQHALPHPDVQTLQCFHRVLAAVADVLCQLLLALDHRLNGGVHTVGHQLLHPLEGVQVYPVHLRHRGRVIRPPGTVHYAVPYCLAQLDGLLRCRFQAAGDRIDAVDHLLQAHLLPDVVHALRQLVGALCRLLLASAQCVQRCLCFVHSGLSVHHLDVQLLVCRVRRLHSAVLHFLQRSLCLVGNALLYLELAVQRFGFVRQILLGVARCLELGIRRLHFGVQAPQDRLPLFYILVKCSQVGSNLYINGHRLTSLQLSSDRNFSGMCTG